MPPDVIKAKCAPYLRTRQTRAPDPVINRDDYTIVATYGAEYRGIVQYYLLAGDVYRLHRLHWVMVTSMLKTLAAKHHSTPCRRWPASTKPIIETPQRASAPASKHACHREGRKPLVARFGGIPLQRQKNAVLTDRQPDPGSTYPHKELITRLARTAGASSASNRTTMEVHHVRKLADLGPTGPSPTRWAALMARRRRKTLVVCAPCHDHIHAPANPHSRSKSLESRS